MSDQITYDDKADLIVDTTIDDMFKVSASDMNQIKNVVNSHADDIDVANNNIIDLNNNKLDINEVLNQASTDTDKPYSADYLNDKLVSVGTEVPTDGRRVFFANSSNLMPNKLTNKTINGLTIIVGDDKSITINGTTNATTNIDLTDVFNLESGSYIISTNKEGTLNQSAYFLVLDANAGTELSSLNLASASEKTFTLNSNTSVKTRIYISTDRTFTNFKIYPMIQQGTTATTYEPYVEKSINVDDESFISMSDLVSVGANQPSDGRRVFFAHSKNVLQHSAYDRTLNGVTLKVNDDKSITLTGTATANTNFNIGTNATLKLKAGTYTFTKGATNVQLLIYYSSASVLANLPIGTASQTITINKDTTYENYRVVISIPNGTQINEIVYPMLRLSTTSNTYEPYIEPSINVDEDLWYKKGGFVDISDTQPTNNASLWVQPTTQNLLNYRDFQTRTYNGIDIVNNHDGTFTINGTATADISAVISDAFLSMSGTWRMLGCPSGGSSSTYMLSAYVGYWGGGSPNIDTGSGTNITYTGNVKVRFYIKSGTTCNNLVFKPMLTTDTSATINDFAPKGPNLYALINGQYQVI